MQRWAPIYVIRFVSLSFVFSCIMISMCVCVFFPLVRKLELPAVKSKSLYTKHTWHNHFHVTHLTQIFSIHISFVSFEMNHFLKWIRKYYAICDGNVKTKGWKIVKFWCKTKKRCYSAGAACWINVFYKDKFSFPFTLAPRRDFECEKQSAGIWLKQEFIITKDKIKIFVEIQRHCHHFNNFDSQVN